MGPAEPAPVQKIKVLPNAAASAPKLRATDNGLALQKVGTISNRKLNEQLSMRPSKQTQQDRQHQHPMDAPNGHQQPPVVVEVVEKRSPTPDYNGSNRSRGRKKYKAPATPNTRLANGRSKSKDSHYDAADVSVDRTDASDGNETENRPHSASENRGSAKRMLRLFKTKSDNKQTKEDANQQVRARSMEYLRDDIAHETQQVRHSREDMSLLGLGTGPVTVFSSQKKINSTDDAWDEPDFHGKKPRPQEENRHRNTRPLIATDKVVSATSNDQSAKDKKQFYFGMTPEDVAVTLANESAQRPQIPLDLDEESRRVMEEFDAVLAESKKMEMASHSSRSDKDKERGRQVRSRRRSPPPPRASSPVATQKKKSEFQRKVSRSATDDSVDEMADNIALNLRPTLPKKPLQLPRFSPSAAWKALGVMSDYRHSNHSSSTSSDRRDAAQGHLQQSSKSSEMSEDEDVFEERIARNARPVAPLQPRVSNEKSADSGISGDAGSPDAMLHPISDKPLAMSSPVPHHDHGTNWTPEQDLGDSSNEADGEDVPANHRRRDRRSSIPPKIIPKSQMFPSTANDSTEAQSRSSSVSKGRKFRKKSEGTAIDSDSNNTPQKYNSLRKLKRSVSGAFAMMAIRSRSKSPDVRSLGENGNWVLSRSAPNSIINGSPAAHRHHPKFYRSEADLRAELGVMPLGYQYPAYSQPIITQRIVYLPQYDTKIRSASGPSQDVIRRAKSADVLYLESKNAMTASASMFDVTHYTNASQKPLAPSHRAARRLMAKKFTFQSTVRVNQKKLLEEKLTKEAEAKERRRLQEVEAMQRVEEEFQRKRAREKASIREQLRLLQFQSKNGAEHVTTEVLYAARTDQRYNARLSSPGRSLAKEVAAKKRLDPEGAPAVTHNRSPTHDYPAPNQRRDVNPRTADDRNNKKSNRQVELALLSSMMNESTHVQSSETPNKSGKVSTAQTANVSSKVDLRREVISSSRTRSGHMIPASVEHVVPNSRVIHPGHPTIPAHSAGNGKPLDNEKKKSIYKRLAEITSEEENISAPPPVPAMMASPHRHVKDVRAPSSPSKAMTQELSEFRQERREYRDYRSPRHHQAPPPSSHRSSTPSGKAH